MLSATLDLRVGGHASPRFPLSPPGFRARPRRGRYWDWGLDTRIYTNVDGRVPIDTVVRIYQPQVRFHPCAHVEDAPCRGVGSTGTLGSRSSHRAGSVARGLRGAERADAAARRPRGSNR